MDIDHIGPILSVKGIEDIATILRPTDALTNLMLFGTLPV